MKSNLRSLFYFCLISLLFLCGCAVQSSEKTVKETTPQQGFIVVNDYAGNDVQVRQKPDYVAPIFAPVAHIISMLGDADKIVAITGGNTRDFLFCEMYPHILKARVVKQNGAMNVEETVKDPKPEIIFNSRDSMDDNTLQTFAKMGIPVVLIGFDSIEQQIGIVSMLGEIMGRQDKAAKYAEYYRKTVELVSSRTAEIPVERQKTVYHAVNELLRTDQSGTLPIDWLANVHVHNVVDDIQKTEEIVSTEKSYVALEELLQADPEYIIINGADVYDYIQTKDQLHGLQAYLNDHIYIMPLGVTRWGHPNSIETPLAMLWTAKTIYPELFTDIDLEEETRTFYHEIFDYDLSDEQLAKILEGREYKEIKGGGS